MTKDKGRGDSHGDCFFLRSAVIFSVVLLGLLCGLVCGHMDFKLGDGVKKSGLLLWGARRKTAFCLFVYSIKSYNRRFGVLLVGLGYLAG